MRAVFLIIFVFLGSSSFAEPETVPVVQVSKIHLSTESETITYPARVEAKQSATILASVDGVVRSVPTLGTWVKKGQTVLYVQQIDPIYEYAQAPMMSPIKGVISTVDVTLGSQVTKGQKIVTVIDPSALNVLIEVPAEDVLKIKKNSKVTFSSSLSDEQQELKLDGISPMVNPSTGTASANLVFKNKTGIPAGTIGRVHISIQSEPSIKIPQQAVVYKGDKPFVRVLEKNNLAKYKPIELGKVHADMIEIKSGLLESEILIKRSSKYIQDNKLVKVDGETIPE